MCLVALRTSNAVKGTNAGLFNPFSSKKLCGMSEQQSEAVVGFDTCGGYLSDGKKVQNYQRA